MHLQVVFHVDEPEKWGLLLRNLQNLLRSSDAAAAAIEVVANGPAVSFYKVGRTDAAEHLQSLSKAGVRFCACENALRGMKISPTELLPFVQTVPSGVLELIWCQNHGFAYLKP
ncbi:MULTISPECIES: DsrE family protein [Caproicibacterium]|uniref:DsrE family protein n=1 Tax=Caproicibacterium argilliputei TaxID=3030016 RepID=A0AA97DCK4_9FIRM|nr:DsrE family protein [Caproicibacterium argilliputei]WOC32995.1 DsrE family protein [Caproicibacterium argilliputei]